jgi:short-subunit dehydrogenase involved in D-alanine esterification of teichoic acids
MPGSEIRTLTTSFGLVALATLLALTAPPLTAQQIMSEPAAPSAQALEGRQVVLVTGSTSGLGREVALAMAERGAHVIVHGRNRDRGMEVVQEITEGPGSAAFYAADFASMAQVRALGEAILSDYERVDVLVNNAGIWLSGDSDRYESEDGYELSFAVNYLSGYLLTEMLLPIIPRSPDSRIVNVASGAQSPIDFDDPMIENGYSGGRSYGLSLKKSSLRFCTPLTSPPSSRAPASR